MVDNKSFKWLDKSNGKEITVYIKYYSRDHIVVSERRKGFEDIFPIKYNELPKNQFIDEEENP